MKKYIFIGTLVFLCVAIALAPARLIARGLEGVEDVELLETRGTVWQGDSRLLVQGRDMGALSWRFDASSLLRLTPGHLWALQHPAGPLDGHASVDLAQAHVIVRGTLGAEAVNPWLQPYDISLTGNFTLTDVSIDLDHDSGRVRRVAGSVDWQGGRVGYTLGGLLKSTSLPPLQALLHTPETIPMATVRATGETTPLMIAQLGDSGFVKVGITKLLTDMLGNPWAGNAADDAIVLEVEEQFF